MKPLGSVNSFQEGEYYITDKKRFIRASHKYWKRTKGTVEAPGFTRCLTLEAGRVVVRALAGPAIDDMTMDWLLLLCVVVAVLASAEDLWRRRVSNWITLGAFVSGLAVHAVLGGWAGVWDSLLGGIFGFLAFLIFYLLRGMGGGDVKLMAGLGAIVGSERIGLAIVLVAMLGGLMAVAYLAGRKLWETVRSGAQQPGGEPARKAMIPYAPAIGLGMLLTFVK